MKKVLLDLEAKASESGKTVFVEGFANKATKDRVNDVILGSAWKTENFESNPIMLFNHDSNSPIGRIVKLEASDEGLKVRGRISNSKDPAISAVRDLVKEGILKTFSVGFEPKDQEQRGDVNEITEAELLEVSVVSVPMNQDSTFEAFEGKSYDQVKERIKKMAMKQTSLETAVENAEMTIEQLAEALEMSVEDLAGVMKTDKPSEQLIAAIAEVLGVKVEDLMPEEEEEEEEEEEKNFQECVSAKIPKLLDEGMDRDQAIAAAISQCEEEGKCYEPKQSITRESSEFEQGQPQIELAKQTNVLLGALISEIQTMNEKLTDVLGRKQDEEVEEQQEEEEELGSHPEEEDEEKNLETLQRASHNLDKLLSKIETKFG